MQKNATVKIEELNSGNVLSGKATHTWATRSKETMLIHLDNIIIREGWNVRKDLGDIKGLAASILSTGLENPLKGDMMTDGFFVISEGHRRYAALKLLEEQGHKMESVSVMLNDKKMTDEQRLIQMFSTANAKPLDDIEKAEVCKRLHNLNYTSAQIGEKLGISRMHADNFLTLSGLSVEEKKAVQEKVISATAAVHLAKEEPSVKKRQEQISKAKASGNKVKISDVKPGAASKKRSPAKGKVDRADQSTIADLCDEALVLNKRLGTGLDKDLADTWHELDKKIREIKKASK